MSVRFVNIDRETPMLLPPDLREWVREDDLAHFVLEAMETVPGDLAAINHRGSGSEQYPPGMMMALLLYCYASGIFSSRRIEAATHRHVSVRYIAGNTHPDHDTIATFRRVNKELVRGSFVRVLELARELGLLQLGSVVVDGTKVWANGAKRATLSAAQVEKQLGFLEQQAEELLSKAEAADAQEPDQGDCLPRELADRAQRRARLEAARLALEEKAQERTRAAVKERERAQREGCERGHPVPTPQVRASDQVNTTDPQSALQPTAREGFIQGYNAQAAVSARERIDRGRARGQRHRRSASTRSHYRGDSASVRPAPSHRGRHRLRQHRADFRSGTHDWRCCLLRAAIPQHKALGIGTPAATQKPAASTPRAIASTHE